MTEQYPHSDDLPNEHELFAMLAEQLTDPHLDELHEKARYAEQYLNAHQFDKGIDADALSVYLWKGLDEDWDYEDENIVVTGYAWVANQYTDELERVPMAGVTVRSNGFILLRGDKSGQSNDHFRAGHHLMTPHVNDEGVAGHRGAVMYLDDIIHVELPYPSDKMRVKRFLYEQPQRAAEVDAILHAAGRDDQALRAIAPLRIDINVHDARDVERLKDFEAFLRDRLVIEDKTTYRMLLQGPVVLVETDEEERDSFTPGNIKQASPCVAKVLDVCLRPVNTSISLAELTSKQPMMPYLDIIMLDPDVSHRDQRFMVPCQSVQQIASCRYDASIPFVTNE